MHRANCLRPWAAVFLGALLALSTSAQQPLRDRKDVLTQAEVGENACGPCALINSFRRGDAKLQEMLDRLPGKSGHDQVRHLIKEYGSKPSEDYKAKKPRYVETSGITWVDMRHIVNDLLRDHDLA